MNDLERQIVGATRPEPRPDLREQVLSAAMPLVQSDAGRLDRIWYSRAWRLAAAVVLVAVVGADALARGAAEADEPAVRPSTEAMEAAEGIAREVGLRPREAEMFAQRMLAPPGGGTEREKAVDWQLIAGDVR